MKNRGERRYQSLRHSKRQKKLRSVNPKLDAFIFFFGPPDASRYSEWYYKKKHSLGCRCKARYRGSPKVERKHHMGYRLSVEERITNRRMIRDLKRFLHNQDPDDFEE